ncbi:hypothetical protein [Pseudarthrobacter sp. PH31-O2]|uniref:hypothetical protein n=1 Tax=Pseudarthrobacter sp. PH31-O2 TaxID=3046206 RepID=UPI0024BA6A37|nr:hypothetical protein [Pseudarthrobacter sp. PH31-O2]MDJ0354402.1 hypothetical protein [Pseudarthrobacter sp. PH31-O2]
MASEIEIAAAAIRNASAGVDENSLIDEDYLGAVSECLARHYVADASLWTQSNQDAILLFRAIGRSFPQVIDRAAGRMLLSSWLDRFFHGVCPADLDPRNSHLALIGPLEELSMSAAIDVRFVVQVYVDASPDERNDLLERLAETSRRESRTT